MFAVTTSQIWPGLSGAATTLVRVARTYVAFQVHRHGNRILLGLDDRMLQDIGTDRYEVRQLLRKGFRDFRDEFGY